MKKPYLIYIIAFGIFGIINTELGVVGILPQITELYGISAAQAGMLVSSFALIIAIFGPFMTLLFSGFNHKKIMAWVLAIFIISNLISAFAPNYTVLLFVRIIPAFLHPVYFSVAFVAAANSVPKDQSTKAASKVFIGLSVGMVLGIPITSFIANQFSLEAAFLFSAAVNALAFIGIVALLPSMPVTVKLSYKKQLGILKKPQIWLSVATVAFIPAAICSVYSYFAEYLGKITLMSGKEISAMLILFGASGVLGNLIAGKLLSKSVIRTTVLFPIVLSIIYLLVYYLGAFTIPMILIIVVWGILFTSGLNISQNWLISEASEAPEFANGLFVSFSNLGIALGTALGGLFIAHMGIQQVIWSGIIFLVLAFVSISLRVKLFGPNRQLTSVHIESKDYANIPKVRPN
ncbi:MFS transporter [Paenibacillus psychroresistens]|uniref:MFS transporter n=1 Tax=Paenibacillus psychroresistens TaxID=1778678 RepID=A0A6B8RPD7_9BACL|nr:MFS transporter [Paenibacillus psychroresistens]QGQ97236.1 MFS transporter [Paenibacillus psychroresistens]